MKAIILAVVIILCSIALNAQTIKFTPFDSLHFQMYSYMGDEHKGRSDIYTDVSAFEMSAFITWKDYKVFLDDVKRSKGENLYEQFIPNLPVEFLEVCLTGNRMDDYPVTGVTWTNAQHYCDWKTVQDNSGEIQFIYQLPSLSQWVAAVHQLEGKGNRININTNYADWTLQSYDESMFEYSQNLGSDYRYIAKYNDPPSMKRKVIMGASHKYRYDQLIKYRSLYGYQDSSYSHVSFRMVKTSLSSPISIDCLEEWIGDDFQQYYSPYDFILDTQTVQLKQSTVNFAERNGQFHGPFISYHPNGTKKSEGLFYKNQRSGIWTFWNSEGKQVLQRNYHNSHNYEIIYPTPEDEQIKALRINSYLGPEFNSDQYYSFVHIQERAVTWDQRVFTTISEKYNRNLFRRYGIMTAIQDGIENDSIHCFDTINRYFQHLITPAEFQKRLEGVEITSFRIKEDNFFDIDRQLMETRIIGISPIAELVVDGDTTHYEVAWFYFPELRPALARQIIPNYVCYLSGDMNNTYPEMASYPMLETLDDILFFRKHSWKLEETVDGFRSRNDEVPNSTNQFKLFLLEKEHDLLIEMHTTNK